MQGLDEPSVEAAMRKQPSYAEFHRWYASHDRIEGAAVFAEKRPPQWRGS